MPSVGFVISNKESRGSRLGREPGTPVARMAGEAIKDDEETPKTETPKAEAPKINVDPSTVTYQTSNFYGDLTPTEAVGKATQLLGRAVGAKNLTQEQYNKLFDPLYKNLQTGSDYGEDIAKFYQDVSKEYGEGSAYRLAGSKQVFQEPTYGEFIESTIKGGDYYDPLDFMRRALEAKAFYRPGGEQTNLQSLGQLEGRLGEVGYYGKGGTPYRGGYRVAEFSKEEGDPFKTYYDKYLAGQ